MTETPDQDEVLAYPEAAALLKISERTLMRLVVADKVPHTRVGGQVRFLRSELLDMLRSAPSKAAG
jgi:excisionase family DNA binding protein